MVTNRELMDLLEELRKQVGELEIAVARLDAIVRGNGGSGIGHRVGCLEEIVSRGDASLMSRLAVIESQLRRAEKLQWTVIATIVAMLVERVFASLIR